MISLGPVSALAGLTVLYAGMAWTLWLLRPLVSRAALPVVWPLAAFMVWGLASLVFYKPTVDGIQNLLVVATFLGLILFTSALGDRVPDLPHVLDRGITWATWIALGLYGVSIMLEGLGTELILGPRPFSMFALIGLAWQLASWRYAKRRRFWLATAIVLMIGGSLSRLALATALALFPLSRLSFKSAWGWLRVLIWIGLVVATFQLAINHVEPLRERFVSGDLSLEVGGIAVNTSGRTDIWNVTWESYVESPWVGKGAGSAEAVVNAHFEGVNHPHSDYLRILHDYGVVGLALWLLAIVKLVWAVWKAWLGADRRSTKEAHPHLAALLSLVAFAGTMITDNVVVYIFLMAPLGVLVGASLGRMKSTRQDRVRDSTNREPTQSFGTSLEH
jgi:O-antigen ligase